MTWWINHVGLPSKSQVKVRSRQQQVVDRMIVIKPQVYSRPTHNFLPWCIDFTRGGGVLSPKSYVDVPAGPRKSDYLYTNFLPNFPPISIPFSKEKHPIWIKLGAFYNNLPKIHPIYVIWAPSSLMKPSRSLYQISRKSAPKGRHIYVYHVNVRTTPPPGDFRTESHLSFCPWSVYPSLFV